MRSRVVASLAAGVFALAVLILTVGYAGTLSPSELVRGGLAVVGLADPIERQGIFELRLWRVFVVAGVGASLSLAGALLQGLFRNPLASPSLLGVTAGASLGASVAVLASAVGGGGLLYDVTRIMPILIVPLAAFLGALLATSLVLFWMLGSGPRSIGTLLLVGVATGSICAALSALVQSVALDYGEVTRAIVEWGFGSFDDRRPEHVGILATCFALGVAGMPFLRRELDLLALGEADAQVLGVHPLRVKLLVIVLSSLLTAGAISVAGQIAFVGLLVPNFVRILIGPAHGRLLPATAFAGAIFLLGIDGLQRLFSLNLRPGVLLSLIGAPGFLFLLLRQRREFVPW